MESPIFSVVLVTLNAAETIAQQLATIRSQSLPIHDAVIIDSSSDDRTAEIAEAAGAKVLRIDRTTFNHGTTRNLGVTLAAGNVIIFMTQDALPASRNSLEELVAPILLGEAVAAYARQVAFDHSDPIEKFWRQHNYPAKSELKNNRHPTSRPYFFSNVCSAFRRDVLTAMGGFPAAMFGEDMLIAYRLIDAGYTVAYQSAAVVHHSHKFSFSQKAGRYFQAGVLNQAHPFLTANRANEREGLATVFALLRHLKESGQYSYIPIAIIDMGARYMSYITGRLSASLRGSRECLPGKGTEAT